MASNFLQNLLAASILAAIFAIIYCRVTKKTLVDFAREIKEIFAGVPE